MTICNKKPDPFLIVEEWAGEAFIDTDGYSSRDRLMFNAGLEFCGIVGLLEKESCLASEDFEMTIFRENESRTRMAAKRFGRHVAIDHYTIERDPYQQFAHLTILKLSDADA